MKQQQIYEVLRLKFMKFQVNISKNDKEKSGKQNFSEGQ